jgi:hypothetical protein
MLERDCVADLAAAFRAYVSSPTHRETFAKRARARFHALDAAPRLDARGIEELFRSARQLAILDRFEQAGLPQASLAPLLLDEYASLLGERADGWSLRWGTAIPLPDGTPETLFGQHRAGRFLDLLDPFLDETTPLRAAAPDASIVVPVDSIGQLPFVERFVRHVRAVRPRARIVVHDHVIAEPGLVRLLVEHVGGLRLVPSTRVRDTHVPRGRLVERTWMPSREELASGHASRALVRAMRAWQRSGQRVALSVCLRLDAGDREDAETLLFSALDAIVAVQWELSRLALTVGAERPAKNARDWIGSWLARSQLADMLRVQLDAELDNKALAPHAQRFCDVRDEATVLHAPPVTSLESRYPLDELSLHTAPFFSRPYGYGFVIPPFEGTLSAKRSRSAFHLSAGARLVMSADASTRATLAFFRTPRRASAFLKGPGRKLGIAASDLEALVVERNLLAPTTPAARPKVLRGGRAGSLHFVGIGPAGKESLGEQNALALRQAQRLWIQDLGLPGTERTSLRDCLDKQRVINTVFYYGAFHLRSMHRRVFYQLAVRRAIDLANKGEEITMAFSGSPAVWVHAFEMARQYAELHPDFDLRLTNAMSFLDSVFVQTPFGAVDANLQLRLASLSRPVDVSPHIDCVLGQVGDTGLAYGIGDRPESTSETLARLYPPDHPVFVVGNDEIDAEPLFVETTARDVGTIIREHARFYLCLVIPSLQRAAALARATDEERGLRALRYLAAAK